MKAKLLKKLRKKFTKRYVVVYVKERGWDYPVKRQCYKIICKKTGEVMSVSQSRKKIEDSLRGIIHIDIKDYLQKYGTKTQKVNIYPWCDNSKKLDDGLWIME